MEPPVTVEPDIAILYTLVEQMLYNAGNDVNAKTAVVSALADLTGCAAHHLAGPDAKKLSKAIGIASNYMANGAMGRHMRDRITLNGKPGGGNAGGEAAS